MRNKCIYLLLLLLSLSLVTCRSDEAKGLRAKLSAPLSVKPQRITGQYDVSALARLYRDQELAMNRAFVKSLEESANGAFERQLEAFEDGEMGFFKDYINMFAYIFKSEETLKDEWNLKSGKYFSELNAKADFPRISQQYTRDVNLLRGQFQRDLSIAPEIQVSNLQVQVSKVDLSGMVEHTSNNIKLELVDSLLEGFGIASLIALAVGALAGQMVGEIIAIIVTLGIGAAGSYWNDKRVMDGLREQYKQESVSYQALQKELDEATRKTYDAWIR